MSSSDVTTNFPWPVLTPVGSATVKPNYNALYTLQRELNANASSVHSNNGGGLNGHMALTVSNAEYLIRSNNVAFVVPIAPPNNPPLPLAPTAAQIADIIRQHTADQKEFQAYHNTDKALVRLLIAAVPETYIDALSDAEYGFANVTCRQLLVHLHTNYGRISIAEKEINHQRMTAAWHPPTPMEALFTQLDTGSRLANAAGEPVVDAQVARIGYNLVLQTGLFPDACREWRLLDPAAQTMVAFKLHFQRMNMDRLESMTTTTAGHGAANAVIQTPAPPQRLRLSCRMMPSWPNYKFSEPPPVQHKQPLWFRRNSCCRRTLIAGLMEPAGIRRTPVPPAVIKPKDIRIWQASPTRWEAPTGFGCVLLDSPNREPEGRLPNPVPTLALLKLANCQHQQSPPLLHQIFLVAPALITSSSIPAAPATI
jgi:hypothetical protein